jgi:hypothetical protein
MHFILDKILLFVVLLTLLVTCYELYHVFVDHQSGSPKASDAEGISGNRL